ncbi:MAG TPA: hypothetical protein DCE56_06280 [Cyanobacteria bacterium UBA8553]|nr:hypothetical protein [Cyanobacteria bacterium UBA8553]
MIDSRDLLLFTVYLIIIFYVFYQARLSLRNEVRIEPDFDDLKNQLAEQNLQDLVTFSFKFRDKYRYSELAQLPVSIKNISKNEETIRVDWDQSSITDFDNVTGRVIRITSGMTDIPQSQALSTIVPNQMIDENLSDDKGIAGPLFKVEKFKKAVDRSASFYLRLFLMVSDPDTVPVKGVPYIGRSYPLSCQFLPKKLTWARALSIALKPR